MDQVLYEERESVAIITFNREEKLNAMNTVIVQKLIEHFYKAEQADHIRSVILTGKGRAFVAGADIGGYNEQNANQFYQFQLLSRRMYEAIEQNKKPFIAAVNGYALGGGFELVLACDLVIAAKDAKMGLPEIKLGLLPGGGGTQKLARIIGRNRAKEFLMYGKRMTAEEAYQLGIANRLAEPESLMDKALEMAQELSLQAPFAVSEAKRLINQGTEIPLEASLSFEQSVLLNLFHTEDAQEGIRAFLEKRTPDFKGL